MPLLDTHTFLWFANDDSSLSPLARRLVENEETILLSMASVWEIAIKVKTGNLRLPLPIEQFIPKQLRRDNIGVLPIEMPHVFEVSRLPLHHRDPFDRLIIAQSLVEKMPVISLDRAFDAYGVTRLW